VASFGTSPVDLTIRRRGLLGVAAVMLAAPAALMPAAWALDVATLQFDQLYKSFGVRGYEFSDKLVGLKGKAVDMRGYMAPPLKPESQFFVLTGEPLALCPFCQSDADWPADIVVVYLKRASALVGGSEPVMVSGRLEVGSWTDPETGFVSQIRMVDATFRRS
jgi:hypothetical protein